MKRLKWTWVALAVACYLANDVLMRLVSANVNFVSGCVVQAVPLVIISLLGLAGEKEALTAVRRKRSAIWLILAYGTAMVLFGNVLYFLAMRFGGLSIASPTVQSQSVWAVILGAVLLKEKIPAKGWAGIVFFAAGIFLIAYFKSRGTEAVILNWHWGVMFGIMAGLSWSLGSVAQKALLKKQVSQNAILLIGTLFGMILLTVFGLCTDARGFLNGMADPVTYKMLLPGFFSSVAAWCLAHALRQINISVVIPVLSVNIIFNTVIGAVYWHEYISPGTITGLLTAFIGILLSQNIRFTGIMKNHKEEAA